MLFRKKNEVVLNVEKIKCQHCATKVVNGLKAIKVKAQVNVENKQVKVIYDNKKITLDEIKNKINSLGFEVL